jgi:O-antigen/teichoic acid export membrane protein
MTSVGTLLGRIPRGTVVRALGLMVSATAAAQAINILLAPVLTRMYSPADFGLYGVFLSLVTILNVVGTLRYELAIPLADDEPAAMNLLVVGLVANVCIIGLLAVCVPVLVGPLAGWTGAAALADYAWLLPVTLFATGVYYLFTYWAIRHRRYPIVARRNIFYSLGQAVTTTGLGVLGVRPAGLLLGTSAGYAAGAFAGARSLLANDRALLGQVSLRAMRRVARRYVRFPLLSSWSGLVNSAGSVVPLLLMSKYFGPTVAGWFVLTTRVVGAPSTLVGEAVTHVYFGELATQHRRDPRELRRLFVTSFRRLLAVGTVAIVLVAGPAPLRFPVVFGEPWQEAGHYALWLIPLYLTQFATTPLSSTLIVFERQGAQLGWDCARLVASVSSIVVPAYLGASALVTIGIFGSVMGLLYVVLLLMNYRVLDQACAAEGPGGHA